MLYRYRPLVLSRVVPRVTRGRHCRYLGVRVNDRFKSCELNSSIDFQNIACTGFCLPQQIVSNSTG